MTLEELKKDLKVEQENLQALNARYSFLEKEKNKMLTSMVEIQGTIKYLTKKILDLEPKKKSSGESTPEVKEIKK